MKTLFFNHHPLAVLGAFVMALGMAVAQPALAQPIRTLQIQGDSVAVDGERIPEGDLPDSLVIPDNYIYRSSFTTGSEPIVPLNGRFFTVEGERFIEVDPADVEQEHAFRVPLVPAPSTAYLGANALRSRSPSAVTRGFAVTPRSGSLGSRLQLLAPPSAGTSWFVQPQTETQRYLSAMQHGNKALYERLMKERELEAKSQILAARIRSLPENSPEREGLAEELRQQLDEIFALKEENRRRETEQLEKELELLRDQLSKREQNREQIIERRLNELLGKPLDLEW